MKRSAWRYLWKSEDIRKKLLITLLESIEITYFEGDCFFSAKLEIIGLSQDGK